MPFREFLSNASSQYRTWQMQPAATPSSMYTIAIPLRCYPFSHSKGHMTACVPSWMTSRFHVWYRDPRTIVHNLLSNPEFDYSPLQEYNSARDRNHRYQKFISGNWARKQVVCTLGHSVSLALFFAFLRIYLIAEDGEAAKLVTFFSTSRQ